MRLLAAAALSLAARPSLEGQPGTGPALGADLTGRPVFTLASPGDRIVVAIFVATDCPVSNRYLPEVARLARQFSAQGARFWLVFPNLSDDRAAVLAHRAAWPAAADLPALLAPTTAFLRQAHVHVTPEAALFPAPAALASTPLWHGRIDDRYLTFGTQRPAATRHDLADAIAAVLAGRTPVPAPAPPVGCAILPRA